MLVQTDGAVRGERTARVELFRGVLTGPGECHKFSMKGIALKEECSEVCRDDKVNFKVKGIALKNYCLEWC